MTWKPPLTWLLRLDFFWLSCEATWFCLTWQIRTLYYSYFLSTHFHVVSMWPGIWTLRSKRLTVCYHQLETAKNLKWMNTWLKRSKIQFNNIIPTKFIIKFVFRDDFSLFPQQKKMNGPVLACPTQSLDPGFLGLCDDNMVLKSIHCVCLFFGRGTFQKFCFIR